MSDRNVRGLLADANLIGHFRYLLRLLEKLDLATVFAELSMQFLSIEEAGLPLDIDDRSLWRFCQRSLRGSPRVAPTAIQDAAGRLRPMRREAPFAFFPWAGYVASSSAGRGVGVDSRPSRATFA